MWTNISTSSRTLAQLVLTFRFILTYSYRHFTQVWLHVPNDRENKGLQQKQTVVQSIIEKKSMINLVSYESPNVDELISKADYQIQAFSVSVKVRVQRVEEMS